MIDKIIYKKIDGIDFCLIDKKGYIEKQAMICFKYGSRDNRVLENGKSIIFPAGVAHFLEHKMFEDKKKNTFEVFNALGASVNAYTNFVSTTYYFSAINNFEKSLEELLYMVSNPYFTKENVEKEKGIIKQEIKMYDDDAYWRVFFNLLNIMYDKENPITKDIAGSVSDIDNIEEDMLYKCYENFYTKDNALVICCGDFKDINSIEEIICKNLKIKDKKTMKIEKYEEKDEKIEQFVDKKMEINQKIFNIGFKNKEKNGKIEDKIISNKIILDIVFGKSSKFYENMYDKGLIDDSFGFDFNYFREDFFSTFSGSSKNPKELSKYIKQELEFVNQKGVLAKDFERIKNKHLASYISNFNSIDYVVSTCADFFANGFSLNSYFDSLKNISINNIEKFDTKEYLSVIY